MPFWQCIGGTTKPGLSSVNLRYANQIYESHSLSSRMCYPSPVWPRPERPCPAPSISDPARGSDTKNPRSQNLETLRLDGVRMYQLSNLGMRTHLGMESWMNYNSRIQKDFAACSPPCKRDGKGWKRATCSSSHNWPPAASALFQTQLFAY